MLYDLNHRDYSSHDRSDDSNDRKNRNGNCCDRRDRRCGKKTNQLSDHTCDGTHSGDNLADANDDWADSCGDECCLDDRLLHSRGQTIPRTFESRHHIFDLGHRFRDHRCRRIHNLRAEIF